MSYNLVSPKVAVERTDIGITKLISSLRNTTEYLQVFIYYRVKGKGAHRPCLYMFGYSRGR